MHDRTRDEIIAAAAGGFRNLDAACEARSLAVAQLINLLRDGVSDGRPASWPRASALCEAQKHLVRAAWALGIIDDEAEASAMGGEAY